jgi:hypothetical protein
MARRIIQTQGWFEEKYGAPQEVFDELLSTGTFASDPSRVEPLHVGAYGWLCGQMDAQLPTTGNGATWFWAQIWRQELADLCADSPGEILLKCRVPRERVLLSHLGDWHAALNRSPLPLNCRVRATRSTAPALSVSSGK